MCVVPLLRYLCALHLLCVCPFGDWATRRTASSARVVLANDLTKRFSGHYSLNAARLVYPHAYFHLRVLPPNIEHGAHEILETSNAVTTI